MGAARRPCPLRRLAVPPHGARLAHLASPARLPSRAARSGGGREALGSAPTELILRHARPPRTRRPWRLREMTPAKLSEQRWNNTQGGVDTERPLRRQRLDAGKYPLPRRAESEVQPCASSFHWNDYCTQSIAHQNLLPSLEEYCIASAAKRSKPSSALGRRTPQSEQVIRDPTR
jgi:hypothetical protein